MSETNTEDALKILVALGMPRAQQNERSALCLLALLNLTPEKSFAQSESHLIGITPMMTFSRDHYGKEYAPNTRETFRRQTVHQLEAAGIVMMNPDEPTRSVNSPKTVYQIEPTALALIRSYGTEAWENNLAEYLSVRQTLADRYARHREQAMIPVTIEEGKEITISPGEHSDLIKKIIEEFGARFVPGGILVYAGDTGEKWGYFDEPLLTSLGVTVDSHGKMPDVIIYYPEKEWLILVEAVTSHGPVDGKRHAELAALFVGATKGLVYVTAFPTKSTMNKYLSDIAWETEVWIADAPTHMIHFNGERFLGPY